MIVRKHYFDRVNKALGRNPLVALLGPRQCGKTTLARQLIPAGHPQYFDLEDPVVARLMENPMMEVSGKRIGVEFKRADAPTATRSMHLAITDLDLDELWVVYPGSRVYSLDDRIKVRPLADCIHPRKTSGRLK
jgi:predicted AAA+ superfamily ATPase